MRNLTLENIVAAVHGDYFGEKSQLGSEISAITTDSRKLSSDCLFAAIRGEHADGHDFIPAAFAGGALAVLCERFPENAAGAVILVPSTEDALRALATFYRAQFEIPVLGITGSVGKTTAKEMCAAVLSRRFEIMKTPGNFNNGLGVPLTLFQLRENHMAAIVEMGVSHFGEMRQLSGIALPDMAIFTSIGSAHLEAFGDLNGVLREKGSMIEDMAPGSPVFVCGDDALLRAWDTGNKIKIMFGTTQDCDVRAENICNLGLDGTGCDIVSGKRRIPVRIPAFGLHMVFAAAGAAAVGIHMGLSDQEIADGIASYTPVGSRSRMVRASRCTIIDDCYNANPTSTSVAIASLATLTGRRVCILGDMFELGDGSESLHRAVGNSAAEHGIELILTCGNLAKAISQGAQESSVSSVVQHFQSREELISALPGLIEPGDTVLVKASHSMEFEKIVSVLEQI